MIAEDLKYTATHEWARIEGDTALVGITDFAQQQLGDITFVDLPAVGASLEESKEMGSIESVKAASDLFSPVTGEVLAVNDELAATPELVNQDPYGLGWMLRIKMTAKPARLMDAKQYAVASQDDH